MRILAVTQLGALAATRRQRFRDETIVGIPNDPDAPKILAMETTLTRAVLERDPFLALQPPHKGDTRSVVEPATAESPRAKLPSAPAQWLLLRGLGRERRHWFDFGALLETTLDARCAYLDLPGVGRRRNEVAPDSIPELARCVARGWEEELQGNERVGIVALSLGAMVALELAFAHPKTISHLVLINASSRLSPPWARFNPRAACELAGTALIRDTLSMEQVVYGWTLQRKVGEAGRYARMACDIRRDSPVSPVALRAQLRAASRFDPPNVSQRTLILSSGQDRLVSPRCSRDLASFLGAPLREHAEAGHDLPLDDPAWLLEQVANWIEAEGRP